MSPKKFPVQAIARFSIPIGATARVIGFTKKGEAKIQRTPVYVRRGETFEIADAARWEQLCTGDHPAAVLLDADGNEVPFVTPKPVIEQAAETFKSDWRDLHQARHPNPHDPSLTDREAHRVVVATSNRERGG